MSNKVLKWKRFKSVTPKNIKSGTVKFKSVTPKNIKFKMPKIPSFSSRVRNSFGKSLKFK